MKNFIRKKLIVYGSFILILSIICLVYTALLYFQKINPSEKTYANSSLVIGGVIFLILGLISGIVAAKNGLIEGLISGLIIVLISLIVNIFLRVPFETKTLIKIIIYLLSSSLGGIIGVNLRFKKKS